MGDVSYEQYLENMKNYYPDKKPMTFEEREAYKEWFTQELPPHEERFLGISSPLIGKGKYRE